MRSAIDMVPYESGYILRFEDSMIAGKLMAMGILPKAQIELIRRNALGYTFVYRINSRFKIALRRDEAKTIMLQ
jgi:Fe2+ transport system protein FeoA